jgi:hypothetical protein
VSWVVLCRDDDQDADWLRDGLRRHGLAPLDLVTASQLAHGAKWEHRVGSAGVRTRIVLADGTVLDSAGLRGVVNRVHWLGAEGYLGASAADRDYATAELGALGLSWLAGLGDRVVNRPSPIGLAGAYRSIGQWRWLARMAGLPIVTGDGADCRLAVEDIADVTALVVDDDVLVLDAPAGGGLSDLVADGLRRLRAAAALDVLEAQFRCGPDGDPLLWAVSYQARLSRHGEPALAALHRALSTRDGACS